MVFHEMFFFVLFESLWENQSIPRRHKARKGWRDANSQQADCCSILNLIFYFPIIKAEK